MYSKSMLGQTTSHEKSDKPDIDDHQFPNSQEFDALQQFQRSRSDGLILKKFITPYVEKQRAPSVILSIPTTIIVEPTSSKEHAPGFKVFHRIKKQRKKNQSDYRKNICGYITKKIIREFTSVVYYHRVKQLCSLYGCDYGQAKGYYVGKIEHVTGPSHIPGLLIPDDKSQIKVKKVFRDFFQWFLRERYLRYLLIEGKMSDKKAYIEYKNNILLSMVNVQNINIPTKFLQPEAQVKEQFSSQIKYPFPIIQIPIVMRPNPIL